MNHRDDPESSEGTGEKHRKAARDEMRDKEQDQKGKKAARFEDLYEYVDAVGHGEFGTVWHVERKSDGRAFACKRVRYGMPKRDLERLVVEVNALRELAGMPGVVRYHDRVIHRDAKYLHILTSFCKQGTLRDEIERRRGQRLAAPEPWIWWVIGGIARGLHTCHTLSPRPVAHNDIKPENVLIDDQGLLVLCDFGLAVRGDDRPQRSDGGTPFYMAPERHRDSPGFTPQADVWSLGCIAHKLAFGDRPFQGSDVDDLRDNVLFGVYENEQRAGPASAELRKLIRGMLAKDPNERPSAMDILRHPRIEPMHRTSLRRRLLQSRARRYDDAPYTRLETLFGEGD